MNQRQPWHRQPEESSKAFHAFMLYRDMLPRERSLEKVCLKCAKNMPYLSHLKRWSSRHQWVARALAHDDHLAAIRAEAQEQAIREMAERQAKQGMALQGVGIKRFLDEQGHIREGIAKDMKDRDAIQAIEVGAKLERIARGEPAEIIKGDVTIRPKPLREYTDEELEELIAKRGLLSPSEG